MREWIQRLLTLQVIVVSFVTLLLVATSATIIAYNHQSHEEATLDLFDQLSNELSDKVIHRTSAYLKPARVATELVADQVQHHPQLLEQDSEELMQFMASMLRVHPQLASTYIGDKEGTFFQLRREWAETESEDENPVEIYVRRRVDRFPMFPVDLVEFQVGDLASTSLGELHRVQPFYVFLDGDEAVAAVETERDSMPLVTPIAGQDVGFEDLVDDPATPEVDPGVRVLWQQGEYKVGFVSRSEEVLDRDTWVKRTQGPVAEIIEWVDGAGGVNVIENLTEVGPDDGRMISEQVQPSDYDPRERTWYHTAERAQAFAWTDAYIFHQRQVPGLSAARPIHDADGRTFAVASSDITLDAFSEFLRTQTVGAGSKVFITDDKGKIIAYPDPAVFEVKDKGLELPHMSTLNMTTMAAWSSLRSNGPGKVLLEVEDERIFASFVSFPDRFGKEWTLVILVPEEVLLGRAQEIQRNSLLISFLIVMVSMLLVSIFARRISGPINRLSEQVDSVRQFHLDNDFSTRSGIWEVQNMAQALSSMQAGLQSFSRYVPSKLVRQLVDSGEVARLGGERKQLAILFSDIQNFTTLSEEMEAEVLMQHLSEYLEVVSDILTEESATIDKYIGDAVMAFWGAPTEDARPTERACMSALRCHRAIAEMNAKWTTAGRPALPTRFGVHVGTTVVGNIGSSDRMNYTIIGDSVNFAARLEAVNKRYGTWTLVSDDVIGEVGDKFLTRPVDIVAVKGKQKGVGIHELLGTHSGPLAGTADQRELCKQTRVAFDLYLSRKWEEALVVLEPLSLKWTEDRVIDILIRRCRAFLVEPPPDDWAGVKVLKEK
jgi:adenylate cyclase